MAQIQRRHFILPVLLLALTSFAMTAAAATATLTVQEGKYDEVFAKRAAVFAQATRCNISLLTSWTCGKACSKNTGVKEVGAFYDAKNDVLGYTAFDETTNLITLAFRATSSDQNWALNFDFNRVAYPLCPNCQVHRGFQAAWGSLKQSILESTKKLVAAHPNSKIAITGHSLGGALAILAAAEVSSTIKRVNFVYTFGQPRIGDKNFAAFIDRSVDNIYRLVHDNDIVPQLPQAIFGFKHTREEIWYDSVFTSYKVCSAGGEDPSCSNSLNMAKNFLKGMIDHNNYFGVIDVC